MLTLYTLNNKLLKSESKLLAAYDYGYQFDSIRVGNQIWMSKNLNLKIGPNNTLVPVTEATQDPWMKEILAYDYANVYDISITPAAYRTDIGLQVFYSQQAAKAVADLVPGWHLPSLEEVELLHKAPDSELLPFLATVYQIGTWNFNASAPNSVQTYSSQPIFESVNPKYWTTREVRDTALKTFYTARCSSTAVTYLETVSEVVSDPTHGEWTNLPVRLIHD